MRIFEYERHPEPPWRSVVLPLPPCRRFAPFIFAPAALRAAGEIPHDHYP
jgi:hypothetical protein